MQAVKSSGRPKGDSDTRAMLLKAALELFTRDGFQAVTTRQIAARAGVNTGMIRYYFVDKAGLFEQMLRETIAPLQQLMQQQARAQAPQDPADMIALYYRVMAPNPGLPVLIFSALHSPQRPEHQIVRQVFAGFVSQMLQNFLQVVQQDGVLKAGVSTLPAQISCISLAVFPFLLPPMLRDLFGVTLNDSFLQQLAAHQRILLQQGILQSHLAGDLTDEN